MAGGKDFIAINKEELVRDIATSGCDVVEYRFLTKTHIPVKRDPQKLGGDGRDPSRGNLNGIEQGMAMRHMNDNSNQKQPEGEKQAFL